MTPPSMSGKPVPSVLMSDGRWRQPKSDARRPVQSPPARRLAPASLPRIAVALYAAFLLVGCSSDGQIQGDVYQVTPMWCDDELRVRATAMAVGDDLVATAAHTFDGATGVKLRDPEGNGVAAEVVYADFEKDVALLKIEQANQNIFEGAEPKEDSTIRLISYDNAETGPEVKSGTLLRTVSVTLDGEGKRRALELEADIERGDSGGPVLNATDQAVGMVFASSRSGDRGWAVTFDEIVTAIDSLNAGVRLPLSTSCDS